MNAIEQILRELGAQRPRVLDVGCGDGYLLGTLHQRLGFSQALAQDIHLDDGLIRELRRPGIDFVRSLSGVEYRADLILLLDVLEHLEHPGELLRELTTERLLPGGRLVITVPAFQQLFTQHDRTLKHFRRYSRAELVQEIESAGLQVLKSGYLFASLLMPRLTVALAERLKSADQGASSPGVGDWKGGERATRFLHRALTWDNRLCLAAQRHGVTVPGLTVWLTCKAQS